MPRRAKSSAKGQSRPDTPKRAVVDTYHGIQVIDEYQWLEQAEDPEVQKWSEAQNFQTRSILDRIPERKAIQARVRELITSVSSDYSRLAFRAGVLFAIKRDPKKQQPFLVALRSADPKGERVIVDPNALDEKGSIAIDFHVPSLDGRLVAVSLSRDGSEDGTVHVYDVASGRELPHQVPRVNYPTGGGSVAWIADGSGFYYTRYPHEGERPAEDLNFYQQVYFHRLGTPASEDTYVIGKDFPRIAEIKLASSDDGRHVLATVANGDGGEFAHYLRDPGGAWTQVTRFEDKCTYGVLGSSDLLYLISREGAPRGKVVRLPLEKPALAAATVVVPESAVSIIEIEPTARKVYVVHVDGGPSGIRVFDLAGRSLGTVPIEPVSSVEEVVRLRGDDVLFRSQSFIAPPSWSRIDGKDGSVTRTGLAQTSPADFSDCEVDREFATSRDGTKVPLTIIHRKGTKRDGKNPVLLSGYGGYGISITPYFVVQRRVWIEQGGMLAIANLRGGGEYGEEWHRAGNLTRKQNVFDDFLGCAQHLITRGYTNPDHLAIQGGSNGGLLMGAALTQRPDLFRAVVSFVGIYDMLRIERDPNGAFNVTEFGTVKDPDQFKALFGYSPYHHVVDAAPYPSILLLTGEHDGRVNPAESRKMTARLQAATRSGRPVLLRTSASSGHGIGTALDEQIEQSTDAYTFLFDQLGVPYTAPH